MSRSLVLVLAVWLLAAPAAADPTRQHPCVGHWTGTGAQSDSSLTWSIDMVVHQASGDRCGTIEYPSLRCGGYFEACEARGTNGMHLVEHYTHNPGTCAPAGTLDIVCTGDSMQWRWSG